MVVQAEVDLASMSSPSCGANTIDERKLAIVVKDSIAATTPCILGQHSTVGTIGDPVLATKCEESSPK